MNKFTVIGYYEESGQIFAHHVEANNSQHAFYVVAQEFPDACFVVAIKGHQCEEQSLTFPGEGVVDAETVLEQEDVFNSDDVEPVESVSNVIADFEIRDWHLAEIGEHWTGPKEHRDAYRFVIEQSPRTKQIYFKVYPAVLDGLSTELELNGLAGCIEIRNGKPGISIGTNENSLPVHVESNVVNGLYIHHDNGSEPTPKSLYSFDHGMSFECAYYKCNDERWLVEARHNIANKQFAAYDFGGRVVVYDEYEGWEIKDSNWSSVVCFETPLIGDSIEGKYKLSFGNESIVVVEETMCY